MGSPGINLAPLSEIQKTYDELIQMFKRREAGIIHLVKAVDNQGRETWTLPCSEKSNG